MQEISTTTKIISVGNSQGIRIKRDALELSDLSDYVELTARPGEIILRRADDHSVRHNWESLIAQEDTNRLHNDDLNIWETTLADGLDTLD